MDALVRAHSNSFPAYRRQQDFRSSGQIFRSPSRNLLLSDQGPGLDRKKEKTHHGDPPDFLSSEVRRGFGSDGHGGDRRDVPGGDRRTKSSASCFFW